MPQFSDYMHCKAGLCCAPTSPQITLRQIERLLLVEQSTQREPPLLSPMTSLALYPVPFTRVGGIRRGLAKCPWAESCFHCIHFHPAGVCRVSRVHVIGLQEEILTSTNILSAKEQALVGIGAAIVAGCQPCTTRLIRSARAAGACERSIRLAIESGRSASTSAIEAMALWAEREQGQAPVLDETFRLEKEKLVALIEAGATFAAHSTATLDSQLLNAQAYDWTNVQIAEALSVASTVARTAADKVEAAAARVGFPFAKWDNSCCSDPRAADAMRAPVSGGCDCAKSAPGT